MATYYASPYSFVLHAYPWGEKGPLENWDGPDEVQREFLIDLGKEVAVRNFDGHTPVMPIRMAVSKGHGTGSSTIGAWLTNWIMSTRPGSIGTVTAGTATQLEQRTWSTIRKWTALCVTAHWWEVQSRAIYASPSILPKGMTKEEWKVVAQTCKDAQSFAGQHAANSTSWYLFDEASTIADEIWKVAYGGLVDGESMIVVQGQCERNTGEFYNVCFGDLSKRWNTRVVDSRKSRFTNKEYIREILADMGEDSDTWRVRVLGLAPRASELQFIDWQRIKDAQARQVQTFSDEPLIAGVDCSDGGAAWNVCRFRRGYDARSIPAIRIPGERTRNDPHVLTARLAEALRDPRPERRISAMFIDAAFGAHIAERLRSMGFNQVHTVRFGGASPDPDCLNWRAAMWKKTKDWLLLGAIPDEETDKYLGTGLSLPGYSLNQSRKLVIESKESMRKRGVSASDDADALCWVAGTMVQTPSGPVPIELINEGDTVTTPFGPSAVTLKHVSRTDILTTAKMSNGATLCGKPSHEIFTFTSGPTRIDALSLTDEIEIYSQWGLLLWRVVSLSSLSFIGDGVTSFKQLAHTFKLEARRVSRKDFFIAGFGQTITALSQKAMRCITRMKIGAIMILGTLSLNRLAPTRASICFASSQYRRSAPRTWSIWNAQGSQPQSGMDHQRESSGIGSTVRKLGLVGKPLKPSASVAELNTKRILPTEKENGLQNTARAHAPWRFTLGPISRIAASALSAARSLWQTVIGRRPVVPMLVQTESCPQKVETFNLTLREHNAYYANGILVFNCLTHAQVVARVEHEDDYERDYSRPRPSGPDSWMVR